MIKVRLAQDSDARELKKLNDQFNGENSNSVEEIEKSLKENDREIVCVVIEDIDGSSEIIGFCCGQIVKSMCYSISYGDITEFFVSDDTRWYDISKQLIEVIEKEFKNHGVNHLHHLTGVDDNAKTQELFSSLGYSNSTKSSYKSSSIVILEKDA
jgi:N-acetylglutamate synthase-like GNAT family acetyltransferase